MKEAPCALGLAWILAAVPARQSLSPAIPISEAFRQLRAVALCRGNLLQIAGWPVPKIPVDAKLVARPGRRSANSLTPIPDFGLAVDSGGDGET